MDQNFDAELSRIMGVVENQRNAINSEKSRQLALAKLRRQKKLIEKENEMDQVSYGIYCIL